MRLILIISFKLINPKHYFNIYRHKVLMRHLHFCTNSFENQAYHLYSQKAQNYLPSKYSAGKWLAAAILDCADIGGQMGHIRCSYISQFIKKHMFNHVHIRVCQPARNHRFIVLCRKFRSIRWRYITIFWF